MKSKDDEKEKNIFDFFSVPDFISGKHLSCLDLINSISPNNVTFNDKSYNPVTGVFEDKGFNPVTHVLGDKKFNPVTGVFDDKRFNPVTSVCDYKRFNPLTGVFNDRSYNPVTGVFNDKSFNPVTGVFSGFLNDGLGYAIAQPFNQYARANNYVAALDGKVVVKSYNGDIYKSINEPFAHRSIGCKINDFSKVGDWDYRNSSIVVDKMFTTAFPSVLNNYNLPPFQSLLVPTKMPELNNVTKALGEHYLATSRVDVGMSSSVISQTFQQLAFQKPNFVIDGSINRFIEAAKLGEHGITYPSNSKSILNSSFNDFTAFVKELHPYSSQGWDKMLTQNREYLKPYHTINDGIFFKSTINFDKLFPNSYKDYKLYSPLVNPSNEFTNPYWIDTPHPQVKTISKPKVDDDKYLKLVNRIQELERQNALKESANESITQEIKYLKEEVTKMRLELAAYEIKNSEMDDYLDNNGVVNLLNISKRTFYRYKDNWTVHQVGSKRLYKKSEIILSIKKFAK